MGRYTDHCRGCSGTCCTGVGSDPCTCEPKEDVVSVNPNIPAHMVDAEQAWPDPDDEACVDSSGDEWPEHTYGSIECKRCGAEAPPEEDETDGE